MSFAGCSTMTCARTRMSASEGGKQEKWANASKVLLTMHMSTSRARRRYSYSPRMRFQRRASSRVTGSGLKKGSFCRSSSCQPREAGFLPVCCCGATRVAMVSLRTQLRPEFLARYKARSALLRRAGAVVRAVGYWLVTPTLMLTMPWPLRSCGMLAACTARRSPSPSVAPSSDGLNQMVTNSSPP